MEEQQPASGSQPEVTNKLEQPRRSGRGFAAMDRETQRNIARKGGKTAHQLGLAHEFTPEEAKLAGRKGGVAVSQDRKHMAAIGQKGGRSRGRVTQVQSEPMSDHLSSPS